MDTDDPTRLEVVHVLLLLQAALLLLPGIMMLVFSGGAAWPLTVGGPALLLVLAAGTVRRWRWARRVTLAVQWLVLLGFAASLVLGLIPQLNFSVNLVTLITNVALPLTIIRLARRPAAATVAIVEPAAAQAAA